MFPSAFGNDPYFMDPFDHINRVMTSFQSPMFASPFLMRQPEFGMPSIEYGRPEQPVHHHQRSQHDLAISPFGMFDGFRNMHNMMRNMQQNMMSMQSFPTAAGASRSFHSSTVIMNNSGNGPRVIQSSSSSSMGPDGVKETRQSMKDSGTGEMRMSVGHHIHDKAHIVEKSKNRRTGDEEEKQEYINIEEEEAENFNDEWMRRMSSSRHHHRHHHVESLRHEPYNRHPHHRNQRHQPQAIEYHNNQAQYTSDSRSRNSEGEGTKNT